MPSRKQWLVIAFVALFAGLSGGSSLAAAVGGAFGGGLVAYAVVAGYNGRDLWREFKEKVAG